MLDKKISITLKDFVTIASSLCHRPEPIWESWAKKVQESDSDTLEAVRDGDFRVKILHYNSKTKEAQNEEATTNAG